MHCPRKQLKLQSLVVVSLFLVFCSFGQAFTLLRAVAHGRSFHGSPTPSTAGSTSTVATAPTRRSGAVLRNRALSCTLGEFGHTIPPVPILPRPLLVFITPDGFASSSSDRVSALNDYVEKAGVGGAALIQMRDNISVEANKLVLGPDIRFAAAEGESLFVVNGEPDFARALKADGVHLPEYMMDRMVGLRDDPEWPRVVGCSVHSAESALEAARLGADYVQVGTIFESDSHPEKEPDGVQVVADVKRKLLQEGFDDVLVIGVGGIDSSNCGQVATAGGDGVAVIKALCVADSAQLEAREIVRALKVHLLETPIWP